MEDRGLTVPLLLPLALVTQANGEGDISAFTLPQPPCMGGDETYTKRAADDDQKSAEYSNVSSEISRRVCV